LYLFSLKGSIRSNKKNKINKYPKKQPKIFGKKDFKKICISKYDYKNKRKNKKSLLHLKEK